MTGCGQMHEYELISISKVSDIVSTTLHRRERAVGGSFHILHGVFGFQSKCAEACYGQELAA